MGWGDPVVGSVILRRPAIESPGYVKGSTGWAINSDGSAEFNNLTIRGTFNGTDFIVNSSGAFFYNGTPAAGNLIIALASVAGTDAFGNSYPGGISLLQTGSSSQYLKLIAGGFQPELVLNADSVHFSDASVQPLLNGAGNQQQHTLDINSGNPTGHAGYASIISLDSTSIDGTVLGTISLIPGGFLGLTVAAPGNSGGALIQDLMTWTTPTVGSGWATGPQSGSFLAVRYRIDAEDNLIIEGAVHSTSATPAATIFTIASGSRPATSWRGPGAVRNDSGAATVCFLEVNSSGAVSITPNLSASGHDVYFMAVVPLGNIT